MTAVGAGPRTAKPQGQELFDRFAIDTRALALVRVGLTSIIAAEWLLNIPQGFDGIVSAARWATLPIALLLLVGYRSRVASVAAWIAYGIPVRADLLSGAEVDLGRYCIVLMLFWMMFLPVGEHLSWDAGSAAGRSPRTVLSVASGGLLIQFFVIYFWAGATKNLNEWLVDRTALMDVLSHPEHGSSLGTQLTAFPGLLELASVATVAIEVLGAILLFLPLRGIQTRRIWLVGAFVAFHIGMAAFMTLSFFPYVMMVAWLVFLPGKFWERMFGTKPTPYTDASRTRNAVAGLALTYVLISSVVTWLYYPAREGLPALIQEIGRHLLLYQQWAMYSVPSTL